MVNATNPFGAADAAIGYLYQCRFALLASLDKLSENPSLVVRIEKFDDVSFESEDALVSLLQTKHHAKHVGNLTDFGTDIWKTLRVWAHLVQQDPEFPFRTELLLITTATAPTGSAASLLRSGEGRDVAKALDILLKVAASSSNKTNRKAYDDFNRLPSISQEHLLNCVTVLDCSPNISDSHQQIRDKLLLSAPREMSDSFLERLEGWWFSVCIECLTGTRAGVSLFEIENKIDELRESFRRDALPVDYADAQPSDEYIEASDQRNFVHQLRLIQVGRRRIEFAIRDYYRASEQLSRWAREELLIDGEVSGYKRKLREAWEARFEALLEELQNAGSVKRLAGGKLLYNWAALEARFPFRSTSAEFLTHGSFQILSNDLVVGWHPDYKEKIPTKG
jgi:hypothetical protein